MKHRFSAAVVLTICLVASACAGGTSSAVLPPDEAKLSYAVGMRMGLQLLDAGTNVDDDVAIHAVQDVLEGKPTMIQKSEIATILNQALNRARTGKGVEQDKAKFSYAGGMRAALSFKQTGVDVDPKVVVQAMRDTVAGKPKMKQSEIAPLFIRAAKYQRAKSQLNNESSGAVFLAKNAKQPGIHVLPDGLQYKIIKQGTGPFAKPSDLIYIKYRGTFINGVVFDQHPHYLTRTHNALKGWSDVLPKMRVGSEWKIYLPPDLAFGHEGDSYHGVGPDKTVIYDLKLLSIAPPGGNYEISSGLGHGLDVGVTTPEPNSDKSDK